MPDELVDPDHGGLAPMTDRLGRGLHFMESPWARFRQRLIVPDLPRFPWGWPEFYGPVTIRLTAGHNG